MKLTVIKMLCVSLLLAACAAPVNPPARTTAATAAPVGAQQSSLARIMEFISAIRRALTGKASTATVPVSLAAANTTQVDQVALGKALFSAKGCVMCHAHSAVEAHPFWIGAEPPNLSQKTYGAEYLRLWLRDPQAVKPQTKMPKVQLNDREIEALIAFLQAAR